ncbi:helitron_like_N domain-containing protein [Trichonephila clavipes]|nr:helitron_like_N domain-containing protein [Trichonephila clavipes]
MWELEQQVLLEERHEASENVTMYISDERVGSDQHRGRYNAPKTNEVAMRTLRVESYLGLADHVNALATEAGMRAVVTLILPSSFIGNPRTMQENFQGAMLAVRDFGKPVLFVTFTCNPTWKEIKDNRFPKQNPHDRPDLVA